MHLNFTPIETVQRMVGEDGLPPYVLADAVYKEDAYSPK